MAKNDATTPSAPFVELLAAAKQLNKASDRVNIELQNVEKILDGANVGLTFWFEETPLEQSDATGDVGPYDTRERTSEYLGYARVEGKWKLAVKRARKVDGFYQGDMDCPYTKVFTDGEPTALLKASRDTRLVALRLMPQFLEAFKEKVKQHVAEIEAATGELFI